VYDINKKILSSIVRIVLVYKYGYVMDVDEKPLKIQHKPHLAITYQAKKSANYSKYKQVILLLEILSILMTGPLSDSRKYHTQRKCRGNPMFPLGLPSPLASQNNHCSKSGRG
jgi:hypothetical protein